MSPLASLQSRIFLASALLTVLSIVVAIYLVSSRVNSEAENSVQRDIVATGALVDELRTTRVENFTMMARLIADAPKLKAAVDTDDPPTVQDVSDDYQQRLHSHLLLVTNRTGRQLASVGPPHSRTIDQAIEPSIREALDGRETFKILADPEGMLQIATVPISIGIEHPDILGTISVGFLLDDALASQLKAVTGSDIVFGMDGAVLAGTLPRDQWTGLGQLLQASRPQTITLSGEDFSVLSRPLSAAAAEAGEAAPRALVLRSRTDQIRFLREINSELAVTAVLGVLLATLLSFAVARTITRPLTAITAVMREVAATGDLTRKIALRGDRRWHDEDARLLATTFNTLTESISRSQRQLAQKERLSSLGRLSTVIAHEVRNPLMIIKSALHSLRQPALPPVTLREAVADIDGEVVRLNRIVNDVLDFARPIRFELTVTDINALCRDAVAAAQAVPGPAVALTLDRSAPEIATDAERLRLALVNLIVNARQAVEAFEASAAETSGARLAEAVGGTRSGGAARTAARAAAAVTVTTEATDTRVIITIIDTGPGIDPGDLSRIFDPYFTTKRGGTGLGLPIAKNIVEGLGGTLTVLGGKGGGTELRIELPGGTARHRPATASVS
jgi:signal transduction histidine kinase